MLFPSERPREDDPLPSGDHADSEAPCARLVSAYPPAVGIHDEDLMTCNEAAEGEPPPVGDHEANCPRPVHWVRIRRPFPLHR